MPTIRHRVRHSRPTLTPLDLDVLLFGSCLLFAGSELEPMPGKPDEDACREAWAQHGGRIMAWLRAGMCGPAPFPGAESRRADIAREGAGFAPWAASL